MNLMTLQRMPYRMLRRTVVLAMVCALASCGGGDAADEPTPEAAPSAAVARIATLPMAAPEATEAPLALLPSMLTQEGLTDFIAQGAVDGDVGTLAWQTDQSRPPPSDSGSQFSAWLQVDLGRRHALRRLGVYALYGKPRTEYVVLFSDDSVNWQSAGNLSLENAGWNYSVGSGWPERGAHRYWRLVLIGTPGPGPWITELAIWSDGLTYTREPVTAAMLSQSGLSGYLPTGIADSDTATYGWHTDSAGPGAWLAVDFGEPRSVVQINAYRVRDSTFWSRAQYSVMASDDGLAWQRSNTDTLPTSAMGWNAGVSGDGRPHRYWRLQLEFTPGPAAWMSELELLTVDRAARPLPLSPTMFSHSGLTGFEPGAIGDGDALNYGWHTDRALPGAWLQVDLGAPQSVSEIGVYRVPDTSGQHLARYQPQWSDDAQLWVSTGIVLQPLQVGWNRVELPDERPHRYWRLLLTNTPGPAAWIGELQLISRF